MRVDARVSWVSFCVPVDGWVMWMSFPEHKFASMAEYFDAYAAELARAAASVCPNSLRQAGEVLLAAALDGKTVFACGNGGSAAIANHLVCDHIKGVGADSGLRPRVHSLSTNIELMTAIANDISYAEVFSWQLAALAVPGDVLVTISSSGDSENVVRATDWAVANGIRTIAMTGFAGGRTRSRAEFGLHVDADNYGIVEDVHQSLMHVLAQYIRQSRMPDDLVAQRRF